jgi:hypothetical protein
VVMFYSLFGFHIRSGPRFQGRPTRQRINGIGTPEIMDGKGKNAPSARLAKVFRRRNSRRSPSSRLALKWTSKPVPRAQDKVAGHATFARNHAIARLRRCQPNPYPQYKAVEQKT